MNGIILLPSLNRPHLMKRFFESYKETESEIAGLLLVDKTDARMAEYEALELPPKWDLIKTDAIQMGDKFREVWARYIKKEFVIILNDDHILRTKNWDHLMAGQIKGHNMLSTNDGWKAPNRMCGAIAISCKIIETLGWIFPPGVQHLYSDDAWEQIAGNAGCCQIMMDVLVEHDHAYKDEKNVDDVAKKVNSQEQWKADGEAYQKWLQTQAQEDIQKIISIQPKQGVMIATPCHDGQVFMQYAIGLAQTSVELSRRNIYYEHANVSNSSLLPHARNTLVDMFLKSRCQKLLFIDADQGFSADTVIRLLNSSRRIICAVTPHKRFPINLNFEPLPADMHYFKDLTNKGPEEYGKWVTEKGNALGEVEVNRAGTGCMMIDRTVFEIMKDKTAEYFPFDHNDKIKHHEYFKMGAIGERFRGEDWFFTALAKELKIPIFIQAHAMIPHHGHWTFQVTQ